MVVRYDAPVPAGVHPALDELGEPWPAETQVGVPEGMSVLVGPDLLVDGRLSRFFLTFAPSSLATARSYASTLATFFGFLDRRGQCWDSATGKDLDAYRFWRLADPANPCRISAASFNRELAALGRLYRWVHARGMVAENPVRVRKAAVGEGRFADVPEGRVRGAKTSDVKWLTSRAFERWRDVGLCGYLTDGRRDRSWRGRNDTRNRAYVNGLWRPCARSSTRPRRHRERPRRTPGDPRRHRPSSRRHPPPFRRQAHHRGPRHRGRRQTVGPHPQAHRPQRSLQRQAQSRPLRAARHPAAQGPRHRARSRQQRAQTRAGPSQRGSRRHGPLAQRPRPQRHPPRALAVAPFSLGRRPVMTTPGRQHAHPQQASCRQTGASTATDVRLSRPRR
ncbi:MAG: site-specific integrase [Actinobacteria bacterium]|nr:site-specific integrase [Actinomycetota bacterium]